MQTLIHVACSKGTSLRTAIEKDARLKDCGLKILREKQSGRRPGWAKLRGTDQGRQGTVNIQWDSSSAVLSCRVINKAAGRPNLLVGDLIAYLLDRYSKRIKHLTLWSVKEPARRKPTM
jgi:hypothetical protein